MCSIKKVHWALWCSATELIFGYLNELNYWSEDEPETLQELLIHPGKPQFIWTCRTVTSFNRTASKTTNPKVPVNAERYREIISNFVFPKWKSLTSMTCGLNETTCDATTRVKMDLLRDKFGENFIFTNGT